MTQPLRHRRALRAINTAHLASRERVMPAADQVRKAEDRAAALRAIDEIGARRWRPPELLVDAFLVLVIIAALAASLAIILLQVYA